MRAPLMRVSWMRESLMRRYLLAVVLSGVPSTVHALMKRDDLLRATRAAGSLVGGGARAGVVVHLAVSGFWTFVLTRLPVRGVVGGAVAGLLIAALDLEVVGRHNARIRSLPRVPQWLDHVAFGVLVAGSGRVEGGQAREVAL
ncbi:hypothetical protein GCM10011609_44580 [Lentzea pudingi]|uniref:VanZ like family protein n=2 Tax=Lentzea pudingi TaxID=1789439 RepID=A0ABQ2I6P5_9PSEU|nr:hypothetical protein GCM10011609_44580 [Lentzea pudingi]